MYKGIATLNAYELCLKRGFCDCHLKEVDQNESAVQQDELPRKAFLFIRINILSTILFQKSTKCEKIKILLQRTPIFSRILANGDASEAADDILVLDSVVIFTLCELSKICCIGALFQISDITSEDPEIKHLQELLLVDRIDGTILKHLYPLLQKNFAGFDLDLVKVSYVLTLLFVRNYCIKLDIKTAVKTIEEEIKGDVRYESLKHVGDLAYKNGNYGVAVATYTSAVMLNSYSSEMFTNRAQVHFKLEQLKAAQLDAYIAVTIDPKSCEGYFVFASSYNRQQLYEDAFGVAKYGLANSDSKDLFYKTLETLHIELESKLNKIESNNNGSEDSVDPNESTEKSIEKKYFPQLVDSDSADSDEETERKDIPELVEASSDSDDSDIVEKKTVNSPIKNKKKKRVSTEDTLDSVSTQIDMNKVHACLKEASEAILSDCGYKAVQIFRGPLKNFIESSELNNLEECEIVCIKYTYGIAYCKSGGYDDLWKCIAILKEITEKHDSVTFPATYYALGLAYRKLNRFKEALNYLGTVNNFLSKGIHFKVYPWPETPTGIQETKAEILKDLVHELIKECENPPNPDAFCRFVHCTYQPTIYYTDPDFKGYISLHCSEQCCLQYHLQCWKTLKNEKNKTDKEFLEEACFTPDCEGIIIKIQNIDKKGDLAKEFTSDFKKTGKQKWAKWEKKADVKEKEKKRKKGTSKSEDNTQDIPCENGKINSRKNSDANDKSNSVQISDSAAPVENDTSCENKQKSSQATVTMELDIYPPKSDKTISSAKSVQEVNDVLKMSNKNQCDKEKIPPVSCVTNNSYELTHKQGVQDISQEFKKRNECNTAHETANNIDVFKNDSRGNDRNDVSINFQSKNQFNAKLEQEKTSEFLVSQCIKNNVYSYMFDFLQHHGPLRIHDSVLIREMSSFPDEVNSMIAECGGIGEFLKNDLRFAFVGDSYVCVVSDLATAYKMNSNSLTSYSEKLQSLGRSNDFKYYEYEFHTNIEQQNCGLNPDAVEYKPTVSPSNNKNADNKFFNLKSFPYLSASSSHKIDDTQKIKSKSCDTVLNSNGNNSEPSLSASTNLEQAEIKVDMENNKRLSVDCIDKLKLSSEFSNSISNVNSNQKYLENGENLSNCSLDVSSCNQNVIKNHNSVLENSKIKKIQTQLLPLLKEYCSEDYNKYHSYVDACIKPYSLRKLPETVCTETETEFENSEKRTSTEHLEKVSEALKALNKQLTEKNLSLENQFALVSKQKQDLLEEISKLKKSLAGSSNDLEVLKRSSKKREEEILSGREYLIKSLTNAHTSIDELKKRNALLESLNSRLGKTVGDLTLSIKEGEESKKKALEEEKKNLLTVKTLQEENDKLKSRVKFAEIQYLLTKKTEYLNRIEDKLRDASVKKQEFTHGLSMLSGSLNPMIHTSMKTIYAQLTAYVKEINALKVDFVKNIDDLIDKVEKGTSLKELKDIDMKKIPDPPGTQNLFPGLDKYFSNSQMDLSLLNFGPLSQMPNAAIISPASASTATIPPSALSTSVIAPPLISQAKPSSVPLATIIPQAAPSVTIIPQTIQSTKNIPGTTPSAKIISDITPSTKVVPETTLSAKIIPGSAPSAAVLQLTTPVATVISPVLSSTMPTVEAIKKSGLNTLNPQVQESFKNITTSQGSFSTIPNPVPTLDKEFNRTCAIFTPPESLSNLKLNIPKVPPGIINSASSSVSSKPTSHSSKESLETFPSTSSKDSLETFPSAERTLASISSSKKIEPSASILEQKKKISGNKIGNSSYDKLLCKLKEQYPSYSQEELISFVKEFRSRRQGKLTGLPIDSIISELRSIIQAKENEKKIHEKKIQPKPNKVLINKKLVPDPKVEPVTEPQNAKKKSAWGIDSDSKKVFSGSSDDDCTICCDPMSSASAYKVGCGHTFHEECIRQWLKNKSNCPVCRVLLLLPEEYPSLS